MLAEKVERVGPGPLTDKGVDCIARALLHARAMALEEAVKIADDVSDRYTTTCPGESDRDRYLTLGKRDGAMMVAAELSALAETSTEEE